MSTQRPELLFVSPRFLFPADSGGKIRTTQILRGMKDGAFRITLAAPAPAGWRDNFAADVDAICDRFSSWPETVLGSLYSVTRLRHITAPVPIPVATDRSAAGAALVRRELARDPSVVVFDFPHAAVLGPDSLTTRSVIFTHNVENWIFRRHAEVANNPVTRAVWRNQYRKMVQFERETLTRFDTVVAVSPGDAEWFETEFALENVRVIPTGVDLERFPYRPPGDSGRVVFTGSMDWMANIDGIGFLLDEIWPAVVNSHPDASMRVIGRDPPDQLVSRAAGSRWDFTGFVDSVPPHVEGASAYAIPLRVGGGTRIKAFEAMAMGIPIVSTTIGVEGLPVEPDVHYLNADEPHDFAQAIGRLLDDADLRHRLSTSARRLVEESFSATTAARAFESICLETLSAG